MRKFHVNKEQFNVPYLDTNLDLNFNIWVALTYLLDKVKNKHFLINLSLISIGVN